MSLTIECGRFLPALRKLRLVSGMKLRQTQGLDLGWLLGRLTVCEDELDRVSASRDFESAGLQQPNGLLDPGTDTGGGLPVARVEGAMDIATLKAKADREIG